MIWVGVITAPLSNVASLLNALMTDIPQLTQALHDKGGAAGALRPNSGEAPAEPEKPR